MVSTCTSSEAVLVGEARGEFTFCHFEMRLFFCFNFLFFLLFGCFPFCSMVVSFSEKQIISDLCCFFSFFYILCGPNKIGFNLVCVMRDFPVLVIGC